MTTRPEPYILNLTGKDTTPSKTLPVKSLTLDDLLSALSALTDYSRRFRIEHDAPAYKVAIDTTVAAIVEKATIAFGCAPSGVVLNHMRGWRNKEEGMLAAFDERGIKVYYLFEYGAKWRDNNYVYYAVY